MAKSAQEVWKANANVPGDNDRLPQMASHTAEACQQGFERLAAWVDGALDQYRPELSQARMRPCTVMPCRVWDVKTLKVIVVDTCEFCAFAQQKLKMLQAADSAVLISAHRRQ